MYYKLENRPKYIHYKSSSSIRWIPLLSSLLTSSKKLTNSSLETKSSCNQSPKHIRAWTVSVQSWLHRWKMSMWPWENDRLTATEDAKMYLKIRNNMKNKWRTTHQGLSAKILPVLLGWGTTSYLQSISIEGHWSAHRCPPDNGPVHHLLPCYY